MELSFPSTTRLSVRPRGRVGRRAFDALAVAAILGGFALVLAGQHSFADQNATGRALVMFVSGVFLFGLALVLSGQVGRASLADTEDSVDAAAAAERDASRPFIGMVALTAYVVAVLLGVWAFLESGEGLFTKANSFLWLASIFIFLGALLEFRGRAGPSGLKAWLADWKPRRPARLIDLWPWAALLAIVVLAAFFRLYQLDQTPVDPTSDHAEKALDIQTVLDGTFPVYFERNTGREIFQMYVAAGLVKLGGMDFDFYTIKLATVLPSILVAPAVYFMTRQFFENRKLALLAAVFAAIAFWPLVTGRIGLRYAYGQLAIALTLAFLFRAVKYRQRNDFLLCGLFVGLGMYSYMAFRVIPFVATAGLALAFLVDWVRTRRPDWWFAGNSLLAGLLALIVFAPLGRYAITFADKYWYRISTRGGAEEVPVEAPVETFLGNMWDGFLMFSWRGAYNWTVNVPFQPALDFVLAGLLALGVLVLLLRWLRHRDVPTMVFAVAFLALLLPSVGSLAYPDENPSFGRASGLVPLIFVLTALPVYYGGAMLRRLVPQPWGALPVLGLAGALVVWVAVVNYDTYFTDYDDQYRLNAQNVSQIAEGVRGFAESENGRDNVFLKAWPHWIDTRLLGLELNAFGWNNFVRDTASLADQLDDPDPRLYILHPDDVETVTWLEEHYAQGRLVRLSSEVHPAKDVLLFYTDAATVPEGTR